MHFGTKAVILLAGRKTDGKASKKPRRTHRQVMADRSASKHVDDELDDARLVKSKIRGTYDGNDLFAMYADGDDGYDASSDEPDDETLASAFVGRMRKTAVYDDFVKPYAESRGADYEMVNHEIIELYRRFAYTGACGMDKFFTIILIMIKAQYATLSRRMFGMLSVKYDKGFIPMNALSGVNRDDYEYITTDVVSTRQRKKKQ